MPSNASVPHSNSMISWLFREKSERFWFCLVWLKLKRHVWRWHTFSLCQHTPLNAPGIYIRTLIPDGPAASDGRLRIGDRILAVNGTSLIGADYQRCVPAARSPASLPLMPFAVKPPNLIFFSSLSFVSRPILLYASYSAVDQIRMGGGRLRFLVAKSDPEVSEKISASSCWRPLPPSWHAQNGWKNIAVQQ